MNRRPLPKLLRDLMMSLKAYRKVTVEMKDLPEARRDGKCAKCRANPAVTRDGRFCLSCLRDLLREQSPASRDLSRRGSEHIGRPARSSALLGGTADTAGGDGDNW